MVNQLIYQSEDGNEDANENGNPTAYKNKSL
jgi:hypothetical protein